MVDESLSAKRSAAGKRGAAARWGPTAATASPSAPDAPDGLVCGTAAELREMAEALTANNTRAVARTRNISASRVREYKARHPHATDDRLRGKVVCEAAVADLPRADVARLRLVNQDSDVAELYLYDVIDSWGYPYGISAAEVIEALAEITATQVDVHINSPGGEVFEGIAIKQALGDHPADIRVCVDANAASIASVIAMAGRPICMGNYATMMIHDASGFCMGNATDMLQMANLLDKVSGIIAAVYADRAGGEVATWRAAMLAETWYTADEAIEAGLADELLDPPTEDGDETATDVAASADLFLLTATAAGSDARRPTDPTSDLAFLDALRRQHTS